MVANHSMTVGVVTQKARTGIYKHENNPKRFFFRYSMVSLALSLFVFWVLTDYSDATLSFNDFAFFANRFY